VPSTKQTPAPTTTPPPPSTGPVEVAVVPAKLSKGRAPQVPYLVDREVRGGGGWTTKIPGTDTIHTVVRRGNATLAAVSSSTGERLVTIEDGKATYTPGVRSLVGSRNGAAAAYAVMGTEWRGGAVYSTISSSVQKLEAPATAYQLEVVSVTDHGKVYYHWKDSRTGPWKLFEWQPGQAPTQVKSVASATMVSEDGTVAASISDSDPGEATRTCSTVTLMTAGKRLWQTCESTVLGFTPDHSVTIGRGGAGDDGTATRITAHDTATGKVIREWTGQFGGVLAEDDEHLLMVWDNAVSRIKRSIVRCTLSTGACETAVGLTDSQLDLGGWRP
jgi:hypothetical protein